MADALCRDQESSSERSDLGAAQGFDAALPGRSQRLGEKWHSCPVLTEMLNKHPRACSASCCGALSTAPGAREWKLQRKLLQKQLAIRTQHPRASLQTADVAGLHGPPQPSLHPPPTLGPKESQESHKLKVRCVAKQLLYNPQRQRGATVQNATAADDLRVLRRLSQS